MFNWAYFPRSDKATRLAVGVVQAFEEVHTVDCFGSTYPAKQWRSGPRCCASCRTGFAVEAGKKHADKIRVPVLYGNNGRVAKAFEADAYHADERFVVEVEAGRGVADNQFLKDLFPACMMDDVDYLAIAVRNVYVAAGVTNPDFDRVVTFFDALFASNRMRLPLKGILIVGY